MTRIVEISEKAKFIEMFYKGIHGLKVELEKVAGFYDSYRIYIYDTITKDSYGIVIDDLSPDDTETLIRSFGNLKDTIYTKRGEFLTKEREEAETRKLRPPMSTFEYGLEGYSYVSEYKARQPPKKEARAEAIQPAEAEPEESKYKEVKDYGVF